MDQNIIEKPGALTKLKSFFLQSVRVWHVLRKPTTEEFKSISKVSALGIFLIGLAGFLISIIIKIAFK